MVSPKHSADAPATDLSDHAARDMLRRDARPLLEHRALVFADRMRLFRVLGFGSWGTLITLPIGIFVITGEVPPGSLAVPVGLTLVGLSLLYTALRALVNGARLEISAGELVYRRAPLWPAWSRRVRLSTIASASTRRRLDSFWHPGHVRGYPVAQPYFVQLQLRDGGTRTLPLTLGLGDAESVASWINAHVG